MSVPIVTIEQGQLQGSTGIDYKGQEFLKFQGIPYAKPPIGELRFKAPQPPEKWTGILDATKEGSACYSLDMMTQQSIIGSEDCLVLNVYTGSISDKLKPVMFWIHGGGFVFGSSGTDLYGPEFLVNENVVLVTINYRLGLLGFLRLEDPTLGVPGNAAMKDMVMALKWVQKNISKFGGDPDNVTVFGESAGSIAVHLLVLSPMGKGLFHKGILQSGCALNVLTRGGVERISNVLKLEKVDEKAVYKHLMESSVEEVFRIQGEVSTHSVYPSTIAPIGITIEKGSNEPAFLSEDPTDIILEGKFNKVVLMTGYNSAEGICLGESGNPNFEDFIPWSFGYKLGTPESKAAAESIKKIYYGNEEPSSENVQKKYELFTDSAFLYAMYISVTNQFRWSQTPTYVYKISLDTELNFFKKLLGVTAPGASHLDDLGYLFKHSTTPAIKEGSREDIALRRILKFWTNFAKFENPTPKLDDLLNVEWKPSADSNNLTIMDIGDDLTLLTNAEREKINFWKNLHANSPTCKKTNNTGKIVKQFEKLIASGFSKDS